MRAEAVAAAVDDRAIRQFAAVVAGGADRGEDVSIAAGIGVDEAANAELARPRDDARIGAQRVGRQVQSFEPADLLVPGVQACT